MFDFKVKQIKFEVRRRTTGLFRDYFDSDQIIDFSIDEISLKVLDLKLKIDLS